jgi:hypothetical protein
MDDERPTVARFSAAAGAAPLKAALPLAERVHLVMGGFGADGTTFIDPRESLFTRKAT